jgi:bacillolysin
MKKIILIILALSIGVNYLTVSAQETDAIKSDSLNSLMKKIAIPESKQNWIKFKDDIKVNPLTIFIDYKAEFNLSDNDAMILYKTTKDDLGFTHFQYQQYYKNIIVSGGTYNVHSNKKGITFAANGKILTEIYINVLPILNEKQIIDKTLKYVNAKEYMWQSDFWEKDLKVRTGKADTTFFPTPQLVIREIKNKNIKFNMRNSKYFLAFQLDIYSSSPNYSQRIFIDANNGDILETIPLQSN